MIGRFHLGLNYDMLIWLSNNHCTRFPCHQEHEVTVKVKDKQGNTRKTVRKSSVEIFIVITENILLVLKPDSRIKNVGKLLSWATLPALEKIKHNLESDDHISLQWKPKEGRKPWVLNVVMND